MDPAEYQRRRRQLDEELRAGIEMLQEGHRAKVEALDGLWRQATEAAPTAPPEPMAPTPPPRERREAGDLRDDVLAALAVVGDEFEKSDLCRALGYTPNRTSLHRVLWDLQGEGRIEPLRLGRGRRSTRYRQASPGAAS